jgi:hypothetical protein
MCVCVCVGRVGEGKWFIRFVMPRKTWVWHVHSWVVSEWRPLADVAVGVAAVLRGGICEANGSEVPRRRLVKCHRNCQLIQCGGLRNDFRY